jgi:peptidoglycan/LPS O-acetylase OafA/YrhL
LGIIRFLLALSVVSGHTNASHFLKFVGGEIAVELFFMISGFYMAMIINNYKSVRGFYISRYLRLYPAYLFCILCALYFSSGTHFFSRLLDLPVPLNFFMIFTNMLIFFQDLVMFLGVNYGDIHFTKNFFDSQPPLFTLLLIPQGWSLGLELSFYLLAPFLLNKSTKVLIFIILFSFILKFMLLLFIYEGDPWTYRFFPSELGIFLMGSIAYRFGLSKEKISNATLINKHNKSSQSLFLLPGLLGIILLFNFIPLQFEVKKILIFIVMFSSIYKVFILTKNSKVHAFIGNLSYPIYCCHLGVLGGIIPFFKFIKIDGSLSATLIIYTIITCISIMIYLAIEKPFEKYRKKFIVF